MIPVAIRELADQESMRGGAREDRELGGRAGEPGGVELVRSHRQLGGALEVSLGRRSDGQRHPEGAKKIDPRAHKGLFFLPTLRLALVHLPAPPPVLGHVRGLQIRAIEQRWQRLGRGAAHLGVSEAHGLALEGVVIEEQERIEREIERARQRFERGRLLGPANLREEEILVEAERGEARFGGRRIIAAGDRLEDASLVSLAEDAAPQRLVEISDHAFARRALRRFTPWRHGLSPAPRARWSPRAFSAINSSSTSELPSMISITRASRKQRCTGCSSDRPSAPWICTA